MPGKQTPDHRVARPAIIHVASLAIVAAAFFASGFWTSRLLDEARVREQSEARFREFLAVGIDLGFLAIDRQKLDEIICAMSEAEWEDREAEERGQVGEE